MEGSYSPSFSGRGKTVLSKPSLVLGLLMTSCAIASAQWVVETNSFRIREPSNVEGEYDAAIGDVSPEVSPKCCAYQDTGPYFHTGLPAKHPGELLRVLRCMNFNEVPVSRCIKDI